MFWNAPPPYPIPASSDFLASAVLDPTRTTGEFDNLCQEYIYSTAPPLTVTSSLTGSTVPSSPSEAAQTYAGLDDVTVAPGLDMEDMSEEGEWERKDSTPVAQRAQRRSFSVVDCRGRSPGQHVAMALRRPQPYRPLHHLLAGAPHGPKCDPVGRRPSHPFDAAKHQGRITYYCVHEDGRKCRMDAPFRKKKSVFDEDSVALTATMDLTGPTTSSGTTRHVQRFSKMPDIGEDDLARITLESVSTTNI
ncbi:hypothetical protein FRB96_008820 [Tulasnella sp. 330]|nr:hypothetical protein FRB96_008820 [Tulasnella sp. 330]KAG8888266.1 hypothetical protein FRB98_008101 [Tulasnella sp. 332]